MKRVCIFIDGSNLYHSLNDHCSRHDLNFQLFVQWLLRGRELVRTYYYTAPTNDKVAMPAQQRFFAALTRIPYFTVRLGRLEPRGNTYVEKGVDVRIAVDMISMAHKGIYDVAILVSCDGDFADAIDAVQETGRHVEVACLGAANKLRQAADVVHELDPTTLKPFWITA